MGVSALTVFLYLQVLDFLTTILFLKLGLQEGNWMVGWLVRWSPVLGVLAAKLGTVLLALIAIHYHRHRVIRLANLGYGGVVVWNLLCMILAQTR
jgi:hypothetical protein